MSIPGYTQPQIFAKSAQEANAVALAALSQRVSALERTPNIGTEAVTTTHIRELAITTTKIAANAITAGHISSNSISANHIVAGSIQSSHIAATAIQAGHIAAGVITGTHIAAGTIYGSHIAANTITSGNIVAGTITADEIQVDTITAKHINYGAFSDSLIMNRGAELNTDGWQQILAGVQGPIRSTAYRATGDASFRLGDGAGNSGIMGYKALPVNPGDKYTVRFRLFAVNGQANQAVISAYERGAKPPSGFVEDGNFSGTNSGYTSTSNIATLTPAVGQWQKFEYTYTVPANVYWVGFTFRNTSTSMALYVDDTEFRRQLSTINIQDGAIVTDKLFVTTGGGNLLQNSSFEDSTNYARYWVASAGPAEFASITNSKIGTKALGVRKTAANSNNVEFYNDTLAKVGEGDRAVSVSTWYYVLAAYPRRVRATVRCYNASGVFLAQAYGAWISPWLLPQGWQRLKWQGMNLETTHADTQFMQGGYQVENPPNGEWHYFDGCQLENGDLATSWSPKPDEILPGTIVAEMVTAGAITGDKISANTITATNIATGTLTADKFNISQLSAITANMGSLTAGTITGGTVQTSASNPRVVFDSTGVYAKNSSGTETFRADAASGAISTTAVINSLAGSTLSTGHLIGQITTTQITDNAISTPKLAAGSVDATKITVSSLSAISADLGTVTAGTVLGATVATSLSGARVVFNASGIFAYDTNEAIRIVIPSSSAPVQLAGRIIASGGFELNAATTAPANYIPKCKWVDTTGGEVCSVFGANIGYAGRTVSSLTAGCQLSGTYRSRIMLHADLRDYWRIGSNGNVNLKGTLNLGLLNDARAATNVGPGLINDPDLSLFWNTNYLTDHVTTPENAIPTVGMDPRNNPFSALFWMKTTQAPSVISNVIGRQIPPEVGKCRCPYGVRYLSSNKIRALLVTSVGTYTTDSATTFTLGTNCCVLITWSPTDQTLRLYVNNVLEGSVVTSGVPVTNEYYAGDNYKAFISGPQTSGWRGYIDEISLFSSVLTTAERTDYYDTGLNGQSTAVSVTERVILDADGKSNFMQQPGQRIANDLVYYLHRQTGGNQSTAANVWVTVSFTGSPQHNRGGWVYWNGGFFNPYPGIYAIRLGIYTTGTLNHAGLYTGSEAYVAVQSSTTGYLEAFAVVYMGSGDYIIPQIFTNTANSLANQANYASRIEIAYLGG